MWVCVSRVANASRWTLRKAHCMWRGGGGGGGGGGRAINDDFVTREREMARWGRTIAPRNFLDQLGRRGLSVTGVNYTYVYARSGV